MNDQERNIKVDEALAKKFDGKTSPKIVSGDDVRKQVTAMLSPSPVYDKGVSTTADDALGYANSLRTIIQYETDVLRMMKDCVVRCPESSDMFMPMIETHVKMIEDMNQNLKECLGVDGAASTTGE